MILGLSLAPATALAAPRSADLAAVWAQETRYWQATVTLDNATYQGLWHPDFLGWPCGESAPVVGRPPMMGPDKVKRSYVMDKRAATGGPGFVSVFYHVRETDRPPGGKAEVTDYEVTHTWVPTKAGWRIISGMCRHP